MSAWRTGRCYSASQHQSSTSRSGPSGGEAEKVSAAAQMAPAAGSRPGASRPEPDLVRPAGLDGVVGGSDTTAATASLDGVPESTRRWVRARSWRRCPDVRPRGPALCTPAWTARPRRPAPTAPATSPVPLVGALRSATAACTAPSAAPAARPAPRARRAASATAWDGLRRSCRRCGRPRARRADAAPIQPR